MQILFRIVKVHVSALVAVIAQGGVLGLVVIGVHILARDTVTDAREVVRALMLSVRINVDLFYH